MVRKGVRNSPIWSHWKEITLRQLVHSKSEINESFAETTNKEENIHFNHQHFLLEGKSKKGRKRQLTNTRGPFDNYCPLNECPNDFKLFWPLSTLSFHFNLIVSFANGLVTTSRRMSRCWWSG